MKTGAFVSLRKRFANPVWSAWACVMAIASTSLRAAAYTSKALHEDPIMSGKAGVHQRESASIFHYVPVKWAGGEVVNALGQFHCFEILPTLLVRLLAEALDSTVEG